MVYLVSELDSLLGAGGEDARAAEARADGARPHARRRPVRALRRGGRR